MVLRRAAGPTSDADILCLFFSLPSADARPHQLQPSSPIPFALHRACSFIFCARGPRIPCLAFAISLLSTSIDLISYLHSSFFCSF
jgi:hypothetical protein